MMMRGTAQELQLYIHPQKRIEELEATIERQSAELGVMRAAKDRQFEAWKAEMDRKYAVTRDHVWLRVWCRIVIAAAALGVLKIE